MKNAAAIRKRYLSDPLPVRLGGVAANLARISSFSKHPANRQVVHSMLTESKYFIEWTAAEAEISVAAELVELQVQMACWQWDWRKIWADPLQRNEVARKARIWSDRVLEISGLNET